MAEVHYIRQKMPLGLGHAISVAEQHVGAEAERDRGHAGASTKTGAPLRAAEARPAAEARTHAAAAAATVRALIRSV
jgi:hypothetical protein